MGYIVYLSYYNGTTSVLSYIYLKPLKKFKY